MFNIVKEEPVPAALFEVVVIVVLVRIMMGRAAGKYETHTYKTENRP